MLLGRVLTLAKHVEPSEVISNFVPPQSFRYLDANEYMKLEKKMTTRKRKQ
ncbi:hypothetical protein OI25_1434 [Paraburkholderia fungorum]|uniref:Uncharacterized protein n=1 Tax=Paraburkholderia fungorum TaxID=134537 RepID=A0AAU8SW39_9BURK|nr:hypothetical protein OI25_1434 [Paraburkholderia fungorum]